MSSTAKVSRIEPKQEQERETPKSQKVEDTREKSAYTEATADPWKALTAESDIGSMLDAINGVENAPKYKGPIDAYSDGLVIYDPVATKKLLTKTSVPHVPDLHNELLKHNPKLADDMKPIVERYEAQIKTFKELIKNSVSALKQPMNLVEIEQTQQNIEVYKRSKAYAVKQLELAREEYDYQKLREKAAEKKSEDI